MSRNAGPIFSVGRQLFVDCADGRQGRTALFDDKGIVLGSLIDGAEVEVVAWVPRGTATRYLVRSTRTELAGWLGAANLRTTRTPRSPQGEPATATGSVWVAPRRASAAGEQGARAAASTRAASRRRR